MIIKITKSGKGLMVTDDFGNNYVTSLTYLLGQAGGTQRAPFIELTRLPQPSSPDRFRQSPLMGQGYEKIEPDDGRWYPPQCSHNLNLADGRASQDGLSPKAQKEKVLKETFTDVEIDW